MLFPHTYSCWRCMRRILSRIPRHRVFLPGFLLHISCAVLRATHLPVLQCLTAIVINSLHPCNSNTIVRASNAHFLRLSHSAHSIPTSKSLAQTLFRGIIRCTKTTGFAYEKWFSSTTQWVHNFAHNFMLQCCSFQISSDGGST